MAYDKQKHVPKKQVLKCRAGQIVSIKWEDVPNQMAILLEKPEDEGPGPVTLSFLTWRPDVNRWVMTRADSDQVVLILGMLKLSDMRDTLDSFDAAKAPTGDEAETV